MEEYDAFMGSIYEAAIHLGEEAKIEWNHENSGSFWVRSYYAVLHKESADNTILDHERENNFPYELMWDTSVSFRVTFFAWRAYFNTDYWQVNK